MGAVGSTVGAAARGAHGAGVVLAAGVVVAVVREGRVSELDKSMDWDGEDGWVCLVW